MSHPQRRGFSLTEMMIVIGIIVILVSVLIPMVLSASRKASATRVAADLQTITLALEQYRKEFDDYPRLPYFATRNPGVSNTLEKPKGLPDRGSVLLAWALMGPYPAAEVTSNPNKSPGDGAEGMGFRIRAGNQSRVYGPYLQADKFKLRKAFDYTQNPVTDEDGLYELIDGYGNPILYFPTRPGRPTLTADAPAVNEKVYPQFPKNPKLNITIQRKSGYVWRTGLMAAADAAYVNADDNGRYVLSTDGSIPSLLPMLTIPSTPAIVPDEYRRAYIQYRLEQAGNYTGPFLLWTSGANSNFFDADDITNFDYK